MDNDILYFGARDGFMTSMAQFLTFMSLCNPIDLEKVRQFAINDLVLSDERICNSATAMRQTVEAIQQAYVRMPRLRGIIFVPGDENPVYSDNMILLQPSIRHSEMEKRIEGAFDTIRGKYSTWQPPKWQVMTLCIAPGRHVNENGTHTRRALGRSFRDDIQVSTN